MTRTIHNNDKKPIQVTMSDEDALKLVLEAHGEDHWTLYWLHTLANKVKKNAERQALGYSTGLRARTFLADHFTWAIGMGRKNPMLRFHGKTRRYKVYMTNIKNLSKPSNIAIKGGDVHPETHDPVGDESFIGLISTNGEFWAGKDDHGNERKVSETDQKFIDALFKDPVRLAVRCAKLMNRCTFCNLPLEDERSKAVGYGATCANSWGLPWGDKKEGDKVTPFVDLYNENRDTVSQFLQAIRADYKDLGNWIAFWDFLEELGYERNYRMPAPFERADNKRFKKITHDDGSWESEKIPVHTDELSNLRMLNNQKYPAVK